MKWSQQRKRIRDFICPELRKRIDFHVTSYRESLHDVGEAWITVDGEKVLGAGYYKWWKAFNEVRAQTEEQSTVPGLVASQEGASITTNYPKAERTLLEQEVYETGFFLNSTSDYLNTSLDDALRSSNHFNRALAMVDRRLGKRRFDHIEVTADDPSIVILFYALRAEVMNRRIQPGATPNAGPVVPVGNSNLTGRPPSVS
jgi:hypothetical protein